MEHHFNVSIAVRYGIAEAIILNNLWYWVKKNEANGTNCFENEYWTYNSIKAFEKLFPYLTNKQIRTTLKHLVDEGLIKTGNFNKSDYDHTTWYSFTEKGVKLLETSNCPTGQIELPTEANRIAPQGKPIPNNKHNIKNTDIETHILTEFEKLWSLYPKKQGRKDALKHYQRARKSGTTYEEVEQGIQAYVEFIKANGKDIQYVKMGSTFFSQEAWKDDWEIRNGRNSKECMGQTFNRGTEQKSRGVSGTADRSGSGDQRGRVTFPKVAYGFEEEA